MRCRRPAVTSNRRVNKKEFRSLPLPRPPHISNLSAGLPVPASPSHLTVRARVPTQPCPCTRPWPLAPWLGLQAARRRPALPPPNRPPPRSGARPPRPTRRRRPPPPPRKATFGNRRTGGVSEQKKRRIEWGVACVRAKAMGATGTAAAGAPVSRTHVPRLVRGGLMPPTPRWSAACSSSTCLRGRAWCRRAWSARAVSAKSVGSPSRACPAPSMGESVRTQRLSHPSHRAPRRVTPSSPGDVPCHAAHLVWVLASVPRGACCEMCTHLSARPPPPFSPFFSLSLSNLPLISSPA